jgi:hypothetical protein
LVHAVPLSLRRESTEMVPHLERRGPASALIADRVCPSPFYNRTDRANDASQDSIQGCAHPAGEDVVAKIDPEHTDADFLRDLVRASFDRAGR